MRDSHPLILERDAELAATSAAVAAAAAGHGALVLVEGAAGIGKTTLLRTACTRAGDPGTQVLTARGLALESGFAYGIVRQLFEPVRASVGPGGWDALLNGAAGLASRVFDRAGGGSVEDDLAHATTHGLYWLAANLAARGPLVIAVDDAHWADTSSLRWLAHLAARIEGLPVALLVAARTGPERPPVLDELRACPACTPLRLEPLGDRAAAELVRARLGDRADAQLCTACHVRTGGNPFLLESLAAALRAPGEGDPLGRVESLAPEPVAQAVLRRVGVLGPGAARLTRALAVLGGPAPLRHAAALAGLDLPDAARLADTLRAADVLTPGSTLEFVHPIVRAAVYESLPPGERALAHADAAGLLERDGADAERIAAHLMRSEPGGNARVVAQLRAAAHAAGDRGAPGTAAAYLRRALEEPADRASRPALLLELGLALASERSPAAADALREAVALTTAPADHAAAVLVSARVLGIWGYHDSVAVICREALAGVGGAGPAADSIEVELFANTQISAADVDAALARARDRLADPDASSAWRINGAMHATTAGEPAAGTLASLAPVLATGLRDVPPDSLTAVYALLALVWNDELDTASGICDAVLSAAHARGSMSMVAHASCLRSMIMRRVGRLDAAAADARLALDFKLATSPPLAVAWAAGFCVDALTCLGRLDEADAVAAAAAARDPTPGWIHTLTFLQARGALRLAQRRPAVALDDLLAAGTGWRALGTDNPAAASWRTAAAAAHMMLGNPGEAGALAVEQLALARRVGTPATVGVALRVYAGAGARDPHRCLAESIGLLEATPARYELALALADLGALLRRSGRNADARDPLRRALDIAQRTGAVPLAEHATRELLAAGARPRRRALTGPDALTGAERRVADLAAEGLSNRQIAQHLFITQPTVETHLRHAFHKLGIASRDELPAHLDTGRPGHRTGEPPPRAGTELPAAAALPP